MSILKFFKIPELQDPQEPPTRPTGDSDNDIIRETLIKRAANLLFYNSPRSKRDFWTECEKMSNTELIQIIREFRD